MGLGIGTVMAVHVGTMAPVGTDLCHLAGAHCFLACFMLMFSEEEELSFSKSGAQAVAAVERVGDDLWLD